MTQEELNNFEKGLKLKKEAFEIEKESKELSKGNLDIAYESLASLREAFGIRTSIRDLDRDIFKNARAIKNQLIGQDGSLANIREYRKDTLKNEKLLIQSYSLEKTALRELSDIEEKNIDFAIKAAKVRDAFKRKEQDKKMK